MHSFFIAMDAWGDRQNWALYGKIATVLVIYFWLVSLIGTALKRNREAMEANEALILELRNRAAARRRPINEGDEESKPWLLDPPEAA